MNTPNPLTLARSYTEVREIAYRYLSFRNRLQTSFCDPGFSQDILCPLDVDTLACPQVPEQIYPFLYVLSVMEIRSYLDIGCFNGGTAKAIMDACPSLKKVMLIGRDAMDWRMGSWFTAEANFRPICYLRGLTELSQFEVIEHHPYDLAFVNDYARDRCRDALRLARFSSHCIAVQGIKDTPSVSIEWEAFREECFDDYVFMEFSYAPPGAMRTGGIGLAIPRRWANQRGVNLSVISDIKSVTDL